MKSSELIEKLTELIKEHGDQDIWVCTGEGSVLVEYVEFNAAWGHITPNGSLMSGDSNITIGASYSD